MNGWDEALCEAKAEGEVLVVRGSVEDNTFEFDPVPLREGVDDPLLDACERAFLP